MDAATDLAVLSQVFGAPRVASAELTAAASRTVAVGRLSWAHSAQAVLGAKLAKTQGALSALQGKAEAVRQALLGEGGPPARGHVGLLAHSAPSAQA